VQRSLQKAVMTDNVCRTPLHVVLTESKDFEIARALIANGADLGNRDVEGKSPCHTFFNMTVGEVMLLYKADIQELQLCDANGMNIAHYVAWSSKSSYRHVLAAIPSKNIHPLVNRDYLGRCAVHFAAQRGNIEVLRELLEANSGLDINCRDRDGQTPLHYAVESKRVAAIEILADAGADVHAVDCKGRSPLHRAAAKNNLLAIDCMLELAGKDGVSKVDHQCRTPAQLALLYRATAAAEYLEAKNAEITQHNATVQDDLQISPSAKVGGLKSTRSCSVVGIFHNYCIMILCILVLGFLNRAYIGEAVRPLARNGEQA
jgi:ankyrin repeat protein